FGNGEQGLTSGDGVTGAGMAADDAPGVGAGQIDDGLRGLELDDHLTDVDRIADGDIPRDQLGLAEPLAEVGEDELARASYASAGPARAGAEIRTHHSSQSQDSSASSTRSTVGK